MANGRCRMHGGPSTGPRTPEGLERSRRARWKHGDRSAAAIAAHRAWRSFMRIAEQDLHAIEPENHERTAQIVEAAHDQLMQCAVLTHRVELER